MNKIMIATVALAAALALGGVAGCSASGGGSSDSAASLSQRDAGGAVAPDAPLEPQAAGAAAGGAPPHAAAGQDLSDHLASRALIRTASLAVRVGKPAGVATAADRAGQIATAAGGSVFADDRTAGKHASARLSLRVPPDALSGVLSRIAALGEEVNRSSSTKDVTTKVADVDSRVTSAQQSIDRLRTLYASATKVGEVIAIESEITARESDLESLQAQQRALAGETTMATLNLSLTARTKHAAPPARDGRGGFLGGLSAGWDAFVTAASAVVTGVGAVLPFLVLALLIVAAGWRVRRRARATRRPPEPAPTP